MNMANMNKKSSEKDYRNIAIYARQSVEKADSISIETQIEGCKKRIPVDEISNVVEYTDQGYSGKNTNRPALKQLMQDVENNQIKVIMIYKLDRMSRNLRDFTTMYDFFKQNNVEVISLNESMDTSNPTGKAMVNIAMVFAEMERETIQLRVRDNYYARVAKDGRWAGGPAPYGYKNVVHEKGKIPTIIVNDEEIGAVKYAFDRYANEPNISLGKLSRMLYELGYRSRGRKNGKFDNVTLARMLQNPIYAVADESLYRFFKIRKINFLNDISDWNGEHSAHIVGKRMGNVNYRKYTSLEEQAIYVTNIKPIVDSRTFIRVIERLEQNEALGKNNVMTNLKELQGILKCGKCGYAVRFNPKPYLCCYNARVLKGCDAKYRNVDFEKVRYDVGKQIQDFIDSSVMDVINKKRVRAQQEAEIKEIEEQIEKLMELYSLGGKSADVVHKKIEELQEKIDERRLKNYVNEQVFEKMQIEFKIPLKYSRFTDQEKKNICNTLINKITLSENGDVEIDWKV